MRSRRVGHHAESETSERHVGARARTEPLILKASLIGTQVASDSVSQFRKRRLDEKKKHSAEVWFRVLVTVAVE